MELVVFFLKKLLINTVLRRKNKFKVFKFWCFFPYFLQTCEYTVRNPCKWVHENEIEGKFMGYANYASELKAYVPCRSRKSIRLRGRTPFDLKNSAASFMFRTRALEMNVRIICDLQINRSDCGEFFSLRNSSISWGTVQELSVWLSFAAEGRYRSRWMR